MKYSNSWHLLRKDEVLSELSTDMYKGLDAEQVKRRRAKNGPNGIWRVRHRSAGDIAIATLFDLATLLLVISAAAAALFDRKYEAGMIALILVIAGIMRTVTYVRANRIFEDLTREKIPVASVIRDGGIKIIPATEIVVGDVIFLEAGDTVPCDGRVVSGDDSVVSERGITENKTPVHKFDTVIKTKSKSGEIPCEFRSNMLFAGSRMISGSVRIVAVACGKNALVSMQRGGIEIVPAEKMQDIERLRKRSKVTSLVMLACVMLLTGMSLVVGKGSLPEVFLSTMAMAVAAMSEFLTAIGYIIIAITLRDAADVKTDGVADSAAVSAERKEGAHAGGSSKIVVRDPGMLASISMPDIVGFCGSQYFKSGRIEISAYHAKGVLCSGLGKKSGELGKIPSLAELLRLSSASSAEGGMRMLSSGGGAANASGGLVARAIEAYERLSGDKVFTSHAILDHCSSSEVRSGGLDCSLVSGKGKNQVVVSGPIDKVMQCCTDIITKNGRETITKEHRRAVFTECASLEFSGGHVVAIAKKRTSAPFLEPATMTVGMTFIGFYSLSQEPEKETNSSIRANIDFIKRSGIVPVLFTEKPDEDLYYCHRFGLFNKNTVRVRASEIGGVNVDSLTSDGMIVSFADIGGVYLTSAYENVVKALRGRTEDGGRERVVSVIGMNVWDAGAIASADIGVAVSRSEYRSVPEVLAKHSSVVIYPEADRTEAGYGGLSGFVRAVKYTRRALENIDSAKIYITASQSARLVLVLASVFSLVPMMSAVFILIWGLLFDFVAALVTAFENNGRSDGYIRKRFIRTNEFLEKEAIGDGHVTAISIGIGIAWGTAVALVIPLMKMTAPLIGFEYTSAAGSAAIGCAVILSGMVLALETMRRGSIFSFRTPNMAQLLYSLVSVVFACTVILTGFGAQLVGGCACTNGGWLAFVPAALVLIASEIAKLVKKLSGGDKKKNGGRTAAKKTKNKKIKQAKDEKAPRRKNKRKKEKTDVNDDEEESEE